MADYPTPDALVAPNAVQPPTPTPVPNSKWVRTVQTFTRSLGDPKLLRDGAPVYTVGEADEAKWGNAETGVDLVRIAEGEDFAPTGSSIFLKADSLNEFDALINDFACLGLTVKDPVTTLAVYRDALIGQAIKIEYITFGSFILNEDKVNPAQANIVGVASVGHNPPPTRAS